MSISWDEQIKLLAIDAEEGDKFGRSVSISKNYAIVGAPFNSDDGDDSGSAYIFKKSDSDETWSQQIKLLASDAATGDQLGACVDIDGNYAIVGAPKNDAAGDRAGSAYIFKKNVDENDNETWYEQIKLLASDARGDSDEGQGDHFASSVSIDGNYAIVGGFYNIVGGVKYAGAAYIFKKNVDENDNETWSQQYKLVASDPQQSAVFGKNVSISGNYAIIVSGKGVYIFKKSDSDETWFEQIKLEHSGSNGSAMGVAIDGNYAIVGVTGDDDRAVNAGAAYIYKKNVDENNNETWSQQYKLVASDGGEGDTFGNSVGINGNYAIISAHRDSDIYLGNGSAYIFKKNVDENDNETWTEIKKIVASDAGSGDDFGGHIGFAASINGNYAIVGAHNNNDAGNDSGSAYIFKLSGDDNTSDALTIAAGETAKTNLRDNLGVAQDIINKMTTDITVTNSEISITTEIKNSIITSDGTQKETKTNIRKKRREFFKILFADNLSKSKIKMNSADIGLDETLKDTLGSRTVKEKVTVLKKNESTPIVISTEVSEDTGIYAELDTLDDSVVFDVGVANKNVTVTKSQNADANTGAVDQWTINYDNVDYVKEEGEKLTVNGYTIYVGSVYIDGTNAGIPTDGSAYDLKSFKIPFAADDNPNITSFSSNEKIREDRHTALANIWSTETETKFLTNSSDLGLDQTVGKPVKPLVTVYEANSEVDLRDAALITKNRGVYGDLSGVGDYIDFTAPNNNSFRVVVTSAAPNKRYMFKTTTGQSIPGQTIQWRDGQWATYNNVTFYFGGVMTNGTNDGITAADPYVFPINGNPYKLPDRNANYCLYADENTFITGVVSQLSNEKQEEMRQWVIEKLGSDTNNGAELVTDGFFYSNVHVNTTVGEFVLDMETKVCNTNNKDVFNVTFKNTRDNTELFKGEHKTTATISWNDNGNSMAVDVDFFENPQIRNGIRMNTVMTKSNPIGLLVEDYEPSLLCLENSKNKLSMYDTLLNVLEEGHRVEGEKLNLQKEGELWTRHKM